MDTSTLVRTDSPWRPALRIGLGLWMATRIGFLLLAWLITGVRGPVGPQPASGIGWPFSVYCRFDAGHFVRIAHYGFFSRGPSDTNVAFFPGYPMAGRLLSEAFGFGEVTRLDRLIAFALLAWVGAAVAAVLLWRYVADMASPRAATVSVIALLCGPYSLFFMASYSEGPFLALALAAWLCAYRQRWWWAGVLAAAATLVRINGLFLLGGLVVLFVLDARRERRPVLRAETFALTLPVLSVVGYFAWLHARTGHWDAWMRAQRIGWQRGTVWPWQALRESIAHVRQPAPNPAVHFQSAMELVFAAVYIAVLVALARRRRWPELTYVGLGVAALFTSSFYQSVPRSILIAFPVFLVVGEWVTATRRRWLVAVAAALSAVVLAVNVACFVRGYFAG